MDLLELKFSSISSPPCLNCFVASCLGVTISSDAGVEAVGWWLVVTGSSAHVGVDWSGSGPRIAREHPESGRESRDSGGDKLRASSPLYPGPALPARQPGSLPDNLTGEENLDNITPFYLTSKDHLELIMTYKISCIKDKNHKPLWRFSLGDWKNNQDLAVSLVWMTPINSNLMCLITSRWTDQVLFYNINIGCLIFFCRYGAW